MKFRTLATLAIVSILSYRCSVHQEMIEIPLEQPDLSGIENGTYYGEYDNYRWYCNVNVNVLDHRIDTIEVLSAANGGKKIYEKLVSRVIEQQTIEVDAVSGATITSNTFLKAVENALEAPAL